MSRNFNGSNQQFTNPTALAVPPMTFSCFFRTNSIDTHQVLLQIASAINDSYYMLFFAGASAGDPILCDANNSGVSTGSSSSGATGATTGVWYHAAGVLAGINFRLAYFNGSPGTSNTTAVAPTVTKTNIGAYNISSASSVLNGEMANAALYSDALTSQEVLALAKGATPMAVRPNKLVDFWPMVGHGANEVGIKGTLLTNVGTTRSTNRPRMYQL